jgi:Na+/proline symporter
MRFHRSTRIGMITAALLAVAVLGPVFFAVVSMRSTPESRGASAGAWVVVAILLLLVAAAAAAIGGGIVALARRILQRDRS